MLSSDEYQIAPQSAYASVVHEPSNSTVWVASTELPTSVDNSSWSILLPVTELRVTESVITSDLTVPSSLSHQMFTLAAFSLPALSLTSTVFSSLSSFERLKLSLSICQITFVLVASAGSMFALTLTPLPQ